MQSRTASVIRAHEIQMEEYDSTANFTCARVDDYYIDIHTKGKNTVFSTHTAFTELPNGFAFPFDLFDFVAIAI